MRTLDMVCRERNQACAQRASARGARACKFDYDYEHEHEQEREHEARGREFVLHPSSFSLHPSAIPLSQRGFSLIEILVALAILSIGIMAVMKLFPISLQQAQLAQERTIATELANSRLGQVWTAGANQLFNKELELTPDLTMRALDGSRSIYERFDTTVQRMAGAGDVYLQRVTFTVRMANGRYETFVTYVSQL